jgi:hypothetical protein
MVTPGISIGEFYDMRAQLNAQDRELKALRLEVAEVKKDIRDLLALANKSQGGLWMALLFGSSVGGILTILISWFMGHSR